MVYVMILRGLPEPTEEHLDPRGDVDRSLDVMAWQTPISKRYVVDPTVDADAPSWWRGDEEATDLFLRGMGVSNFDELAQKR